MNLIVILLCFAADRYLPWLRSVRCYGWFSQYLALLNRSSINQRNWHRWTVLALIVLPLVLLAGLCQWGFYEILWGIPGILFNILVLFYCLGATDFKGDFTEYFAAKDAGDFNKAKEAVLLTDSDKVTDQTALTQQVTAHIFKLSNQQMVSILFWFVLLGGFGALTYRLFLLFKEELKDENSPYILLRDNLEYTIQLLEWVPARLLTICFALAGDFPNTYKRWLRHCLAAPAATDLWVVDCGFAALGMEASDKTTLQEGTEQAAIELLDRSLILMLVLLALLTIGFWV